MLRVHLMQQWYDLSDPAMEDALIEVPTMRRWLRGIFKACLGWVYCVTHDYVRQRPFDPGEPLGFGTKQK
jgi:hypothetical protein